MAKRKIVYIIVVLLILEINILYIDYEPYILLLVLAVLPVLLYVGLRLQVRNIKVQCKSESSVITEGDILKCIIEIQNKSIFPISNVEMNIIVHYDNYDENSAQTFSITAGGREKLNLIKKIQLNACGNTTIQVKDIVLYDYVSLFRIKYDFGYQTEVAVIPKLIYQSHQRERVRDEEGAENGEMVQNLPGTDSSEILDLRKYVEGDRLNRVHWKLSSRNDDLIVKEFGSKVHPPEFILVELFSGLENGKRQYINSVYEMVYALGNYLCNYEQEFHIGYFNMEENIFQDIVIENREKLDITLQQLMKLKVYEHDLARDAFLKSDKRDVYRVHYIKSRQEADIQRNHIESAQNAQFDFKDDLLVNDKNIQTIVDLFYLNV